MIIKRYIVSDMKEAFVRAKYELGADAILVSQRVIKTGKWYNPFKKKELEVTMAIEESVPSEKASKDNITISESMLKSSNDSIKEKLVNYCKLHGKEDYNLTLEEKKDFFSIVFKESPIDKKLNLSKTNVFVGPTGVGKTTTIAKIAAREYLINKKKVGLITIDTYRIGAVEQLRTYANILGVQFEVVNEPKEMEGKLKLLSECDIILIDTLGTSHKDFRKIDEIKRHMQNINVKFNTYLVLSLSTDRDTIVSILDKYKELKYSALIITKLDEVSNMSNLWYLIENNSSPIQYICYGQDVPDDIQVATLENIFKYCEESLNYDGSGR
jgi:flagellar biosynthesis protein FlhF